MKVIVKLILKVLLPLLPLLAFLGYFDWEKMSEDFDKMLGNAE